MKVAKTIVVSTSVSAKMVSVSIIETATSKEGTTQ
jgi:hypothetical protein